MTTIDGEVATHCERCGEERSLKALFLRQWQGHPGEEFLSEWVAVLCRGCAHDLGVKWARFTDQVLPFSRID